MGTFVSSNSSKPFISICLQIVDINVSDVPLSTGFARNAPIYAIDLIPQEISPEHAKGAIATWLVKVGAEETLLGDPPLGGHRVDPLTALVATPDGGD